MRRYRQQIGDLLASVSRVAADWRDELADRVIDALDRFEREDGDAQKAIRELLNIDFEVAIIVARMILGMSKDEFVHEFSALGDLSITKTAYAREPDTFVAVLVRLGLLDELEHLWNRRYSWKDILLERLRSGRGSAIKGQSRGRALEDFTERLLVECFGPGSFDVRCRFTGAGGTSTEKADFAIPGREDPCILIEVKAYGATGSKQTDILGDVARIAAEKRPDTTLLLVTDGVSWHQRQNDLKKLVEMQNRGLISRIYTQAMADALSEDLRELRRDYQL